jgi:hypothetical protein
MDGIHDLFAAPLRALRGQRSALSQPLFVNNIIPNEHTKIQLAVSIGCGEHSLANIACAAGDDFIASYCYPDFAAVSRGIGIADGGQ